MALKTKNRNRVLVVLVLIALAPIILTAFEVIFSENQSIVFLGNFNPKVTILVISYYILLFGFGLFWFVTQLISINRLENEKAKTELMVLKNQVSPHFFFNMLNNLYGLVTKDTKQAQELILKLSDLMRYSIYEGENDTVTLGEEIDYLRNYIELHKMRYHKNIDIEFDCDQNRNKKVTPLLFIILLENSFKHGVENLRENAYVRVNITSYNNEIRFSVENNFDGSVNEINKPGIGLKNLKRRLELVYPGKHQLTFSKTENVYTAQLILNQ
jgi:LytS/YehU family sensor histidine kinase